MRGFTIGPPPGPKADVYYGCPYPDACDTEPIPEYDYDPQWPPRCNRHDLPMTVAMQRRR